MTEERANISRLFAKAESLRDYPGSYFPARQKAEDALISWRAKYPLEAQAEKEREEKWQAEERDRREEEFKNSFIGRGLD